MRDLRTPERQIVRVNSITNDGRMTGQLFSFTPSFQVHAFRTLADGTLEDLGDTVYTSVGWGINSSGDVTGYEAHTAMGNVQSAFRFFGCARQSRSWDSRRSAEQRDRDQQLRRRRGMVGRHDR